MTCAPLALSSELNQSNDALDRILADPVKRLSVEERFWPKVMRPLDWNACWLWTGARKRSEKDGYGSFKLSSYRTVRAHRLSFALYTGKSPGEFCVCHRCDTPLCVNPTHLFLGTHKDNSDDKISKGRFRSARNDGEHNGAAKLTAADVEVIRNLIARGNSNVAIAARFGVTHQAISRIRRGRSWGKPAMQPKYQSLRLA